MNWDFESPAHFCRGTTQGRVAFYESLAKKVLPLLSNHRELQRAQLHFLLEDDACINMTGNDVLNHLARVCYGAPLTMCRYFNPQVKPKHSPPPKYGTQMFSIRGDFCEDLASHMQQSPPCDIDMYFLGIAPCSLGCTSLSVAGQGVHASDCSTKGEYRNAWLVEAVPAQSLSLSIVDQKHRTQEWAKYTAKEPKLFEEK